MFALTSSLFRLLLSPRYVRAIALENLALRQQLAVMKRQCPRPRLRKADPLVLGLAIRNLAPLAKSLAGCPTGDGGRLASARIAPFLDLDFEARAIRASRSEPRNQGSDPKDGGS